MTERPIAKIEEFKPKLRFRLQPFGNIKPGTSRNYLIKGLIPREGLVVVWGPPKCGKTFWTFDAVMHVALGCAYRGRRVEQGAVVYVACEGERGLAARAEAFRRGKMSEEVGEVPFFLLTTRLDLVGDVDELASDIRAQINGTACGAIVIDTLNRSIRGSESVDADMGAYVKAADALREAFRCATIIIHHCGTDGTRPRGHTSLTGAADAQIAVKRGSDGNVTTVVEWMKDGPEGVETFSALEVIDVGEDEDGEAITSCVVKPIAQGSGGERRRPLSGQAKVAFDQLQNALADEARPAPDKTHYPAGRSVVPLDIWRRYCMKGGLAEGDNDETFKKAWKRVRERLLSGGFVGVWDDFVWIVDTEGDKGT